MTSSSMAWPTMLWVLLALAVDVSHEKASHSRVEPADGAVDDDDPRCPAPCSCSEETATTHCAARNLTSVQWSIEDSASLVLLLGDNQICQVDLDFLKHYPRLQTLSLRGNSIRALVKNTDDYKSYFSVEHIDLSENHLHMVHPYVFSGFPNLKTLNLSGNVIHTLSTTTFTLPSLQSLDLSRNRLEQVHSYFFDTSPKLVEIDLSHNQLSRLNDGTFGLLTHLAVLDLSHNSVMRFEDNVLVGMNITHLDLGFNALRRVPTLPLRKLTAAKTLLLDGNLFSVLEPGSFREIRAEFLSVSFCPALVRMEQAAFTALHSLETLTLNNNPRLAYIHPGAIADCPRLEALDLSANGLYALEETLPDHLTRLKALYLSGNPFQCHCGLAWIGKQLESGTEPVVEDGSRVQCRPDGRSDPPVRVRQLAAQYEHADEGCEPYILPLFGSQLREDMGRNVSWLCKALGGADTTILWRFPDGSRLSEGTCQGRACVKDSELIVHYLHPSDAGRYTCIARNKYGQDQREVTLSVKAEHIQIFPITIASTFVTVSWNTSSTLSTKRGYILQVMRRKSAKDDASRIRANGRTAAAARKEPEDIVKQYEDIDVGLKMNSYTVNDLRPGETYLFQLCLRKDRYVITISSTELTTRNSGYEMHLGIETDYVSLFAVAIVLTGLATACISMSAIRLYRYHSYAKKRGGSSDSLSQREMITSPSDHSSVNCAVNYITGDQSRLVEHEMTSPVDG